MQKQVDYTEAIKTKYPEQVVIVTARDADKKPNPCTVGWAMPASGSPAMLAVALHPKRYTTDCIRQGKCFTVTFPAADMDKITMLFGTKSGKDTDKFEDAGCKIEDAKEIDSVLLTDAIANFECTLEKELETGDHIIFVGKVVAAHMNTEKNKRLYTVAAGGKLGAL